MAIMSKPTGTPSSSIIEDLRNRLASNVSRDPEALLQAMSESERNVVLHVVKQIDQLSRVSGASPAAILNQYFPHMGMERRKVFLAILGAQEERPDYSAQDSAREQAWAEWDKLRPIEEVLAAGRASRERLNVQTQAALSEPQRPAPQPNDDLTDITSALIASESSGNPQAEYVADDGSRYSGALQIGAMRLADANAALGTNYSQDDLINNQAIQNTVNDWHMRDLARQVDAFMAELGDEAANWSRNSLIAASHIGGVGGMKRHVRSGGEYDPHDALGTSISDYVNRFRGSQS
ncbi:hypothetical protein I3V23_11175 [Rhodobacterales bacterium HKCCA1288]|jgi:hypothetical protein|nr:hypothetical protein I3V23_11175 [Rhodobacterales bacterium HKCCA1288]